MTAFLLTWDGSDGGDPADYVHDIAATARHQGTEREWSFGSRRSGTSAGDRVFLLRQHTDRGIVASGTLTQDEVFIDEHWEDPSRAAAYVAVRWETVVAVDERLPIETLVESVPGHNWNQVYGSGQMLTPDAEQLLESRWAEQLQAIGRQPNPTPSDDTSPARTPETVLWMKCSRFY